MKTYIVGNKTIVVDGEVGRCKIGKTTNFSERRQALKTLAPFQLERLLLLEGDREEELHTLFHKERRHGEWFVLSSDLLDFIDLERIAQGSIINLKDLPLFQHQFHTQRTPTSFSLPERERITDTLQWCARIAQKRKRFQTTLGYSAWSWVRRLIDYALVALDEGPSWDSGKNPDEASTSAVAEFRKERTRFGLNLCSVIAAEYMGDMKDRNVLIVALFRVAVRAARDQKQLDELSTRLEEERKCNAARWHHEQIVRVWHEIPGCHNLIL